MSNGLPADDIAAMALWLLRRTSQIRQRPDAADCVATITRAAARAQRAIDRPPDLAYLGTCETCHTAIYATPHAAWAACACGAEYEVAARREQMRPQVEDLLGSAAWCATVSTAMGSPVTESTVRWWAAHHRIHVQHYRPSRKREGETVALYRAGDVMKLAGEKRSRTKMAGSEKVPAGGANAPGTRPI